MDFLPIEVTVLLAQGVVDRDAKERLGGLDQGNVGVHLVLVIARLLRREWVGGWMGQLRR